MLGFGLVPLTIVTLLWASALRRPPRGRTTAGRFIQLASLVALGLGAVSLYLFIAAPEALASVPAEHRASSLASRIDTAFLTVAAAYAIQVAALITTVALWREGTRAVPREP